MKMQAKDVESHADAPHHGASELAPPAEQGGVQEPVKVEVILPPAQPEPSHSTMASRRIMFRNLKEYLVTMECP